MHCTVWNCLRAEEYRSLYIRYVRYKGVCYIGISLHYGSAEDLLNILVVLAVT